MTVRKAPRRKALFSSWMTTAFTRALTVSCVFAASHGEARPAAVSSTKGVSRAQSAPRIEVQGHRGARARFPENTIPAFRHAIAVGADGIELDVVATSDDVLAVLHDPVVNEQICTWTGAGVPVRPFVVREHTFAELRASFDCGAKQNPRFPSQTPVPGTPIPSLDEVLALLSADGAQRVHVNIEAKSVPARTTESPPPDRFARLIVDEIARHRLEGRAIIQSFDHDVLRASARIAPKIRRAALVDQTHVDVVAVAKAARATIFSPHHEWITAADVAALKRARIAVVPWTANATGEWERLVTIGVDGIITDDPEALIGWLASRADQKMNP
jgi:glycerophosphoryl diester phosphodiesterase